MRLVRAGGLLKLPRGTAGKRAALPGPPTSRLCSSPVAIVGSDGHARLCPGAYPAARRPISAGRFLSGEATESEKSTMKRTRFGQNRQAVS